MSSPSAVASEKVVAIRQINTGRFAHTVTQEDMAELARLSREFSAARQAYDAKKEWIIAAIRAGAAIEPGLFRVRLVPRKGGGYFVEAWESESLVLE